jgi:ParB-like chromosome segregation protein Spo0J
MSELARRSADAEQTSPPRTAHVYDNHPLADVFPLLENEELRELSEDIRKHGLLEPIVLFEGKIIDGRNRYRMCKIVGHVFVDANFRQLPSNVDPKAFVISANVVRRHLTVEQKRGLLASLLKADPTRSDRQIAETVKVDHKTVGAVRQDLQGRGEIPHTETRTDSKGRQQKGKKKVKQSRITTAQAYDKLEEKLIEKLVEFTSADHADEHAQTTIKQLKEAVEKMREAEKLAA